MNDYMIYRLALKNGIKPAEKKKHGKIAQFSKKRQKENREYSIKSRPYWKGKPCAIKSPGCTHAATGIHHLKGRLGELLMDEKYWLPACGYCNTIWVEQNHAEAEKKGLKLSRLKK